MKIAIRTDASLRIGSGHLMRCRTLAEELKLRGADVHFVCRSHSGNLNELLQDTFTVHELSPPSMDTHNAADEDYAAWLGVRQEEDAADTIAALQGWRPDWLVVDHYSLDKTWENVLRPYAGRIMVIDDLANRVHDCDLLLDQNFYTDMDTRYTNLVPCSCQLLLGPKHALLRPEFREARKNLRIRDGKVQQIFVFFGGADPTNETAKVIQALKTLELECIVDVVVGASNPNKEGIKQECIESARFKYHEQIDNIAELMAKADLAIGAGGTTTWERCCLGLPTLTVAIATNQKALIHALKIRFALVEVPKLLDYTGIVRSFFELIQYNEILLTEVQRNCLSLCDGAGSQCIADRLLPKKVDVRTPTLDDAYPIYKWRNDKRIREISLNKEKISFEKHLQWFKVAITKNDCIILLAEVESNPIGVIRFDLHNTSAEISIFINPDYIGQGFGRVIYLQAESYLKANRSGSNTEIKQIKARVLADNIRSESFFSDLGYQKILTEYRKDVM